MEITTTDTDCERYKHMRELVFSLDTLTELERVLKGTPAGPILQRSRSALRAEWIGAGYGADSFDVISEFTRRYQRAKSTRQTCSCGDTRPTRGAQ